MKNTDGCADQYRCAVAIYLMSVMLKCYSVMIDRGISAPGHGKEVVDGLNGIDEHYIYKLMSNVHLQASKTLNSQILMHSITQNNDVSLEK